MTNNVKTINMSKISSIVLQALKILIPALRSAAEKAWAKQPAEVQEQFKKLSTAIEVVKIGFEKKLSVQQIIALMIEKTGLTHATLTTWFIQYWQQKGHDVHSLDEAISLFLADASARTSTGLKSLWKGFVEMVGEVVTGIDWSTIALGVVQLVWENFVKGRVRI